VEAFKTRLIHSHVSLGRKTKCMATSSCKAKGTKKLAGLLSKKIDRLVMVDGAEMVAAYAGEIDIIHQGFTCLVSSEIGSKFE
jgi:hypothetical protein